MGTSDCYHGYCSAHCRTSAGEVPGACNGEVSAASVFSLFYGCPADHFMCVPGLVSGVDVYCRSTADCAQLGPTHVCAGAQNQGDGTFDGVCMPAAGEYQPTATSAGGTGTLEVVVTP